MFISSCNMFMLKIFLYCSAFLLCLITTTNKTLPLTVVCADQSTTAMTVTIASNSVGLSGVPGWQDEMQLIPMDTTRAVAGFAARLQQQQLSLQMGPVCLFLLMVMPIMPWILPR